MFGFIRPVKDLLEPEQTERFQSVYCGLCHTIRRKYGNMHTLTLSYDLTFLALLLMSMSEDGGKTERRRCAASPVRRRRVLCETEALVHTADISVLLTYHKLGDSVSDEHGVKRLGARAYRACLTRGYQRAKGAQSEADSVMNACLAQLSEVERVKTPSIDRAADPFACLLAACAPQSVQPGQMRVLKELLYHTGRWIYLIDACFDIEEDWKSGNYNPVILRYGLKEPALAPAKEQIEKTLERSLAAIHAAFVLLDIRRDESLLQNIICTGLPIVTKQVLEGTYQSNGGQNRHGSL